MSRASFPAWMEDALCAQVDPALFYPDDWKRPKEALKLCGLCDVRLQCLEYALDWESNGEKAVGVFGGMTASQRIALNRKRGRQCLGCGISIPTGANRPLRCEPCNRERRRETQRGSAA